VNLFIIISQDLMREYQFNNIVACIDSH